MEIHKTLNADVCMWSTVDLIAALWESLNCDNAVVLRCFRFIQFNGRKQVSQRVVCDKRNSAEQTYREFVLDLFVNIFFRLIRASICRVRCIRSHQNYNLAATFKTSSFFSLARSFAFMIIPFYEYNMLSATQLTPFYCTSNAVGIIYDTWIKCWLKLQHRAMKSCVIDPHLRINNNGNLNEKYSAVVFPKHSEINPCPDPYCKQVANSVCRISNKILSRINSNGRMWAAIFPLSYRSIMTTRVVVSERVQPRTNYYEDAKNIDLNVGISLQQIECHFQISSILLN